MQTFREKWRLSFAYLMSSEMSHGMDSVAIRLEKVMEFVEVLYKKDVNSIVHVKRKHFVCLQDPGS